jgi:hypothetical protein
MITRLFLAVALVGLLACGDDSDPEATEATSEPTTAEPTPEPDETTPPVEDDAHTAAGLRVRVNDDGSVTVAGVDRWGTRVDTTYADAEYFRNAVEVLRRSFTEEQQAAIDAALAELPAPTGEADEPSTAMTETTTSTMTAMTAMTAMAPAATAPEGE